MDEAAHDDDDLPDIHNAQMMNLNLQAGPQFMPNIFPALAMMNTFQVLGMSNEGIDIFITAEGGSERVSVRTIYQRLQLLEKSHGLLLEKSAQQEQYIQALEEKMNTLWITYPMPGYQEQAQEFDKTKAGLEEHSVIDG